jgi:hypothetical protein
MFCFSKTVIIISILAAIVGLALIVQAQDIMESPRFKLKSSYLEIQKISPSQSIPFSKKENNEEEVVGQARIVDEYLISDIPENEFLGEHPSLKFGFRNLEIAIEADQPFFKRENFYQSPSFSERTKSLLGFETLPEYRLIKEIKKEISGSLETNLEIPGLVFKTSYEKKEETINNEVDIGSSEEIKQNLVFKNNSQDEINIQLTLTHSLEGVKVFFGEEEYLISEKPRFLSPQVGNIISFPAGGQRHFSYDFFDLLEFNPEVWIFREGFENLLLVRISLSLLPYSSIVIDPVYKVSAVVGLTETQYSWQRKTWYDGTRYWAAFYHSGDNKIKAFYATAADCCTWTENASTAITTASNDFSVWGNSTSVYIVWQSGANIEAGYANSGGGYPGTAWDWRGSNATSLVCQAGIFTCNRPYIFQDGSSYLWAVWTEDGLQSDLKTKRSLKINNVSAGWNTASTVDSGPTPNKYGVGAPTNITGGVYFVWEDGARIDGRSYQAIGWGGQEAIASGTTGLTENFSLTHDANFDFHLLYENAGKGYGNAAYRNRVSNSWSS